MINFKKSDIKYRTCCYFDDITKIEYFEFDNILFDEKLYKNMQIYNTSYKAFIGPESLRIMFDKIDGLVRVYDGTRYLVFSWRWKIWFHLQQDEIIGYYRSKKWYYI